MGLPNNCSILTGSGLDSIGTILVLNAAGVKTKNVEFHSYESVDNAAINAVRKAKYGDSVFITNITPSENACAAITAALVPGVSFLLADHHYSRRYVRAYPWALFDTTKSSSTLLYEKFYQKLPPAMEGLVEAINSWSMWQTDSPCRTRAEQLNNLLSFVGKSEFINIFNNNPNADQSEPWKSIIICIEKRKDKYVQDVVNEAKKDPSVYIDGLTFKFKIAFSKDYVSDVARKLLHDPEYADIDYVVVVNPFNNRCSLRSRSIDVRVVAKALHGGGNWRKDTAGFPLPIKEHALSRVVEMLQKINY